MSKLGRVGNVLFGLLLIAIAAVMVFALSTQDALMAMVTLLAITLALYGLRTLWLYISLARHMVGGKALLYVGVLAIDAAAVVMVIMANQFLAGIYLSITYFLLGAVNAMHVMDDKQYGTPWRGHMVQAVIYLLLGIACLVLNSSADLLVTVYCIGLVYNAVMRIYNALRPQAVAYIA